MKGSWGERVLGGRVLGLWGIIRRGEYIREAFLLVSKQGVLKGLLRMEMMLFFPPCKRLNPKRETATAAGHPYSAAAGAARPRARRAPLPLLTLFASTDGSVVVDDA